MATDMVRTQIQLTHEQAEHLRRLAAAQGVSLAALIREAVDGLVGERLRDERLARARRAVGAGASGRRDVSERHDEHLTEIYGADG